MIDPRRTVTAEYADVHLQVKPGTDAKALVKAFEGSQFTASPK